VALPYNLLLHKNTRESLNVSLAGSVVIIDEAHNLIDTILGAHTVTTTSEQISQAIRQIDTYLKRFRDRLKGSNEMHLRQVRATLTGLEKLCLNWSESKKPKDGKGFQIEEILTASQVVQKMGGNLDTINVSRNGSGGTSQLYKYADTRPFPFSSRRCLASKGTSKIVR